MPHRKEAFPLLAIDAVLRIEGKVLHPLPAGERRRTRVREGGAGVGAKARGRGRAVWGGKDGRGRTVRAKVDIPVEPLTDEGDVEKPGSGTVQVNLKMRSVSCGSSRKCKPCL
jgi:hypothetical protein